jgi:hypothetical protein
MNGNLEDSPSPLTPLPNGQRVTISGHTGDDAKPYQERAVEQAIEESQS